MKKLFIKQSFWAANLLLVFWLLDVTNKIFIMHAPLEVLWYSSLSLLFIAVALFKEDAFLLSAAFCVVFLVEGIWIIGFLSILLTGNSIPGVAEYAFSLDYPKREFIITLYHFLLIPAVLVGIISIRTIHKQAWVGALLFATFVITATFLLVPPQNNINCLYTKEYCQSFLETLYRFPIPLRMLLGITLITLFAYIPTNYLFVQLAPVLGLKVQSFSKPLPKTKRKQ